MTSTVLARVQGLAKTFRSGEAETTLLDDVDLELAGGEFRCVMGPSGSGKTSLLHLISGLDAPTRGRVELLGDDLAGLSERERTLRRRACVGYVFQFFHLLPDLTVEENIALPLAIDGRPVEPERKALRALAERLGLASRLDAHPHQLSGGEMQRASIARALIGGQPLLLCDEPTGNLSQQAGLEVMELLRACVDEERRAVLLVTHNPRDATFADRVDFLVDGRLSPDVHLTGPGLAVEDVHAALASLHI